MVYGEKPIIYGFRGAVLGNASVVRKESVKILSDNRARYGRRSVEKR